MTSFSGRRLILACIVAVAALVAVVAPGTASAASDLGSQCSGANIKGHGSSFQAPILVKWAADFNEVSGKPNKNAKACGGTQGSKGKPKVEYLHEGANSGSGACLHGWGIESTEALKFGEFQYCGTDEAPNPKQKTELESHKEGGEGESLETIPVLQGAVAVIVHLPEGCKAESEIKVKTVLTKLGRLVLDNKTLEGVYQGTITTWKQLLENQEKEGTAANKGAGKDKLTCTEPKEVEDTITPVVRLDHSGTTHIFKSYLEQVNTETIPMEAYPEEIGGKKTGCGKALPEESEKWTEVAEACQNQRWPTAAKVVRGTESGNPGVVKRVNETPSSIGYADLAVAREFKFFSAVGSGGENTSGEQNTKFWAEVQDTKTPEVIGFSDPATNGDVEAAANSRCKSTKFTEETGKKFPPKNTRAPWNEAKAELAEKEYSICGLTYDLALRQYGFYPGLKGSAEGKGEANTVHDFLLWALNKSKEGGGALEAGTDYERLPTAIIEEAEDGVEEIGFEVAGTEDAKEKT
jgi:ABC-type phosphate transport system substrate-binding protein